MNRYLLEIKKIKKIYQHKNKLVKIFDNINLKIKKGDLIALVGPSGSGKSTFLNMISLLEQPTSGTIIFRNKNSKNLEENEKNEIRKNNISMVFQDNNLLSDFTALENVAMPLMIRKEDQKKSYKKAERVLNDVNLSSRLNHFPDELSGGEQQRVAIARTIISESDLILADEPTGNLDHKTSQEIFSYFLKLKNLKKTIIFATHNRELAKKADYKLSILDGNIKRVNA
jgi:ABC-type lipoprotein export system ATPase subunit